MAAADKTPPNYRTNKNGKPLSRVKLAPTGNGRHQANASVPPIVYTNGIGERLLLVDRSVKLTQPTRTPTS